MQEVKAEKTEKTQDAPPAEERKSGRLKPSFRGGGASGADSGLQETVVTINRVTKVVKGGKRFSFSALVVTGDKHGQVGAGFGKAKEVQAAIKKASAHAKKNMFKVPIFDGTIPHAVVGRFGSGQVWMKPAYKGTGVIAGGGVRATLEAAGVTDILTKNQRSSNPFNMVYSTLAALKSLKTKEEIAAIRGRT